MSAHTCITQGRSSCTPCMQFEIELWDTINRYAISVGGDPDKHVYGNIPRMQAVADVGTIIRKTRARELIDDLTVEELVKTRERELIDDLVKGHNAAAAYACASNVRIKALEERLGAALAAKDELADVADKINSDHGNYQELLRRREQIARLRKIGHEVIAVPPRASIRRDDLVRRIASNKDWLSKNWHHGKDVRRGCQANIDADERELAKLDEADKHGDRP